MINGAVSLLWAQPADQDQQYGPKQCSRRSADGNEGKAAGGNKDIGKNKNRENEYVHSKDPIKNPLHIQAVNKETQSLQRKKAQPCRWRNRTLKTLTMPFGSRPDIPNSRIKGDQCPIYQKSSCVHKFCYRSGHGAKDGGQTRKGGIRAKSV